MTYKQISDTQIRATYEDTKNSQEKLRVMLDDLDKTNSCIEENERSLFFISLADSLLGLDSEKPCKIQTPSGTYLDINNLGRFLRELAYYENIKIDYDFLKQYGLIEKTSIDIGFLWHKVKFIVYGLFPEALAMSLRISKEQLGFPKQGEDSDATDYNEL